jgi:DNA-3-methyladenine glycosylase II
MKTLSIKTPAIFSFKECVKFLGRSKDECLFSVENEKVRKLFIIDEIPILIEFYAKNKDFLELKFLNLFPTGDQISAINNYMENWLGLNYELQHFYEMAKGDKILGPLVKKYFGLRLIGIPDFYEAICWAIIGQQINLGFAYSVKKNLVERFGTKYEFEGKYYFQFPDPEKVISISKSTLSELKFSRQKTAYIQAISKSIVDQTFDIEYLKKLDYSDAKKELMTLHGIGNWSADYILMKTFLHPQAFPIQDAGLQNALKKQIDISQKPSIEKILEIAKPWKGFEAYATFYLWRSLYD